MDARHPGRPALSALLLDLEAQPQDLRVRLQASLLAMEISQAERCLGTADVALSLLQEPIEVDRIWRSRLDALVEQVQGARRRLCGPRPTGPAPELLQRLRSRPPPGIKALQDELARLNQEPQRARTPTSR